MFRLNLGTIIFYILIGALTLNSISYIACFRLFYNGVDIVTIREHDNGKAVYLIGGCLCRTKRPFEFMLNAIPPGTNVYLIEYRNSGFNIEKASKAISDHICAKGYEDVTFIAISLGYQLAARTARQSDKIIALNPCIGRTSLASWLRKFTPALAIGYLATFIIGWLSYAPIVKVDGRPYYSLKLLFNQFRICCNNKTLSKYPFRPNVLVLSKSDRIIDNAALIKKLITSPKIYSLSTNHFWMGNNSHLYYDAVVENLSRI